MKTREFSRILLALAAALLLADCSGGNGYTSGGTPIFASGPTYYVSNSGSDINPGTSSSSAFLTITHALSVATSGSAVSVAPGTYNAPNEAFPLMVPDGVQLIGDEVYKGLGYLLSIPHTTISGGGASGIATVGATIVPGNGSTVAGFEITNTNGTSGINPSGIVLIGNNATIRKNTVTGSTRVGIYVGGGTGNNIQTNDITTNMWGVQVAGAGADLGGGSASSPGGNLISCNTSADLLVSAAVTVSANNNSWDHASLTLATSLGACTGGVDICNLSGAPISPSSNTLAASACP
jgi:parallel beta-helix repeat protein